MTVLVIGPFRRVVNVGWGGFYLIPDLVGPEESIGGNWEISGSGFSPQRGSFGTIGGISDLALSGPVAPGITIGLGGGADGINYNIGVDEPDVGLVVMWIRATIEPEQWSLDGYILDIVGYREGLVIGTDVHFNGEQDDPGAWEPFVAGHKYPIRIHLPE